tara:strand:- start:879 stop:1613 length:735 start_codon:yes stop_codon:yes gene_type:complete
MTFKNNLKFFLRNFGIDINRYNINESFDYRLQNYLNSMKIDLVIDVGANNGQYGESLRKLGYKENILSFEPLEKEYKTLKTKTNKDNKWKCLNLGLGDRDEIKSINIAENSVSSSIMEILDEHINANESSKYISNQSIQLKRLDQVFNFQKENYEKVFLKIDTQGYEEKVIDGSSNLLNNFIGIQIELSVERMYENQLLYIDIIKKLKSYNYDLWDLKRGFHNPKTGQIYQFDGIFFNRKNAKK